VSVAALIDLEGERVVGQEFIWSIINCHLILLVLLSKNLSKRAFISASESTTPLFSSLKMYLNCYSVTNPSLPLVRNSSFRLILRSAALKANSFKILPTRSVSLFYTDLYLPLSWILEVGPPIQSSTLKVSYVHIRDQSSPSGENSLSLLLDSFFIWSIICRSFLP